VDGPGNGHRVEQECRAGASDHASFSEGGCPVGTVAATASHGPSGRTAVGPDRPRRRPAGRPHPL